jgi:formylglycine-generating enzyme required for sulfatase activity
MVAVPGGRFTMGRDGGEINERPAHKVFVTEFLIDRFEVSAREFAAFLNVAGNPDEHYTTPDEFATVLLVPDTLGTGRKISAPRNGYENYPANNVSWHGADAYCRWLGKRLPTEAEWEKAARGRDRRLFPWGKKAPTPAKARFAQDWTRDKLQVLVPVDTLPEGASPYGPLHMAGNVLEWVQDWYRQNLCNFCDQEGEPNLPLVRQIIGAGEERPVPGPDSVPAPSRKGEVRADPAGPSAGSFKVLRGGSWQDNLEVELMTTHRFWLAPEQRFPQTGFRCAMRPPVKP